jgi:hypothetical protein
MRLCPARRPRGQMLDVRDLSAIVHVCADRFEKAKEVHRTNVRWTSFAFLLRFRALAEHVTQLGGVMLGVFQDILEHPASSGILEADLPDV